MHYAWHGPFVCYDQPSLSLARPPRIFHWHRCLFVGSGSAPAPAAVETETPRLAASTSSSRDVAPAAEPDVAPKTAAIVPHLLPDPWAAAPLPKSDRVPAPPTNNALAAVVIDEASGAVLYEKDAHDPLPPASLTKIATLILALEHGGLDDWVDVDVDSRTMRGSTVMGLIPGDRFTPARPALRPHAALRQRRRAGHRPLRRGLGRGLCRADEHAARRGWD